jgi:hypothetical protein
VLGGADMGETSITTTQPKAAFKTSYRWVLKGLSLKSKVNFTSQQLS